jgi:hypothetical protein
LAGRGPPVRCHGFPPFACPDDLYYPGGKIRLTGKGQCFGLLALNSIFKYYQLPYT